MRVELCTIVLNAMPWIRHWLEQHYDWADRIIIVEGADRRYPGRNVTDCGLSRDQTAYCVHSFPDPGRKITFIQHGWAADKAELRDRYAHLVTPGALMAVPDSDEFVPKDSQRLITAIAEARPDRLALTFPIVHFWQPPGSVWPNGWPRSRKIVTGSYADIPHTRFFRGVPGMRYRGNHNHPEFPDGRELVSVAPYRMNLDLVGDEGGMVTTQPHLLHYGFCLEAANGEDKNRFYMARNETVTRPDTTQFRGAWLRGEIPLGAKVLDWAGGWPECFDGGTNGAR